MTNEVVAMAAAAATAAAEVVVMTSKVTTDVVIPGNTVITAQAIDGPIPAARQGMATRLRVK